LMLATVPIDMVHLVLVEFGLDLSPGGLPGCAFSAANRAARTSCGR
jgi:hypothetical protein